MSSPTSGRGWSARFPVYQIDFTAVASGKRVASTKRRVRWRFGFPNLKALDDGLTGTDCRGEEHDVTVVWSVTSGKRQITMDGREVHYSSSRSGVLDHSWATRGNHVIKVIAHAAPPLSATPGFRQYDMLIDGQSFFNMPKVYELGIRGPIPSHARIPGANDYHNGGGMSGQMVPYGGGGSARGYGDYGGGGGGGGGDYGVPGSRAEEEAALQLAIQASIAESRKHLDKGANDDQISNYSQPAPSSNGVGGTDKDEGVGDLLDFGGGGGGGNDFPQIANTATPSYDNQSLASAHTAPAAYGASQPHHSAYFDANLGGGPPTAAAPYGQNPAPYQSPPAIQQAAPVNSPNPSMGGQLVPAMAPPGYYGAPPPQQPPTQSYQVPPAPAYQGLAPTSDYSTNYGAPPSQYGAPPSQHGGDIFSLSSPPQDDPFAPKPPPPPTHNDIANSILGAYSSSGSMPSTPVGAGAPGQNMASLENGGAPPQGNEWKPPALTMGALEDTTEKEEVEELNPLEAAMRKLVNIERIDEPAEQEVKLTMMKKEAAKKGPHGKSKGLPPVGSGMVGSNATLSQIKDIKPSSTSIDQEKIMRAPPAGFFQAGAVNAGALVVHGQGPPPLQQMTGFGLGASLPNGGFNQQQQQPYPTYGQMAAQQPHPGYQQHPSYQQHPGYQQQYPTYQQQPQQQQYYR